MRQSDYEEFFAAGIRSLKDEGRYRVFAELERHAGDFSLLQFLDEFSVYLARPWPHAPAAFAMAIFAVTTSSSARVPRPKRS